MKSHFLSLVNPSHRWLTLSLLVASVLLVSASQFVGTTDNLPGLLLLFVGVILLFFTFLHPWRKSSNYVKLSLVSVGVAVLTFVMIFLLSMLKMTQYISEALVMSTIFLFCLPGIVVGMIGNVFFSLRKK